MGDVKTLPPGIARILNKEPARHEFEPDDDVRGAFDEVRLPRSRSREAIMLDVRKANGSCHGMSYAYLVRVDYEPGDLLKVHFADTVVQIGGKRLYDLYRRLLEHRVDAIQEGTEAEEGLKPDEASHIDRIELITRKEADHDED